MNTILESGNAARKLERDSAGTVNVEVSVKPAELFAGEGSGAVQVAATNSYVLVQRRTENGMEYSLFNEANRPITLPSGFFPAESMSYDQIRGEIGNRTIALKDGGPAGSMTIAELGRKLELSPGEAESLRKHLLKTFGDREKITSDDLYQNRYAAFNGLEYKLSTDIAEKHIILQRGSKLNVYRTVDEDMRPLPPEQWKRISINDTAQISQQQLDENPVLADYRVTPRGRVLDALNCAASLTNGVLTVVDTKAGTRIMSEEAQCYALDPMRRGQLVFVDAHNNLRQIDLLANRSRAMQITSRPLPFEGEALQMRFDPHGNFLAVVVERNQQRDLLLLERDSLRVAATIDGVGNAFDFNRYGEIYFIDRNSVLRMASTNLHNFSPDGLSEARELERRKLALLVSNARAVSLPEVPEAPTPSSMPSTGQQASASMREAMVKEARSEISARLSPEIEKADSTAALKRLGAQVENLKATEEYRDYPEVFSEVDEAIAAKMDSLETGELVAGLKEHRKLISGTIGVDQMLSVHEKWGGLERMRRRLRITDDRLRESVDKDFEELRDKTRSALDGLEKGIEAELKRSYPKVEQLVRDTIYERDLSTLRATPELIKFEGLISNITNPEARHQWRADYRELLRSQEERIRSKESGADEEKRTRIAEALEDAKALLSDIEEEMQHIQHSTELQRWRTRNPLILRYRALLLAVPEDMRQRNEEALEGILEKRKRELLQIQSANIMRQGQQVKFEKEVFPVFPETRLVWRPAVKANGDPEKGQLVFREASGKEFVPDNVPVPFNLEDPVTKAAVEAHRLDAEAFFESAKPKVPKFHPKWVLNKWNLALLDEIAQACREQLELGAGIVILEGEAGCGKDVLWKMFGYFTQRGIQDIPCNEHTEKEDLLFSFEFNQKEGTTRKASKFVEAVQIPGTVCLLGEVNTAPKGVVKILNSAMDDSRKISLPHSEPVEIDRSVILAGTMNPQNYDAVHKLSPEVISRATIIHVDYPPFADEGANRYLPYEAEILAKFVPALADVKQEEFYAMWDYVVNRDTASDGAKYLTDDRKKLILNLFKTVQIANRVRDDYSKFQAGDPAAAAAEFVFSMRETRNVAQRLKPDSKLTDLVKKIVLPKISNPEEKMRISSVIDSPET